METSKEYELGKIEKITKILVSVVVITYNSGKYVLETIESTKTQTYQSIELIISDDCSTDNTVTFAEIGWRRINSDL